MGTRTLEAGADGQDVHLCGNRKTQTQAAGGAWLWAWLGSTGNTPWQLPQAVVGRLGKELRHLDEQVEVGN